ncbi:MAG: nucleotidyltransferase [Actinomycetota bacterium]
MGLTIPQLLDAARAAIEINMDEIEAARERRGLIRDALLAVFPGSRVYFNGSVAHGDAKSPLSDIDLGVIMAGADDQFGPGLEGPRPPMELARDGIREGLSDAYPKLRVQVDGKRRAVEIRFGEPVSSTAEDFTADVIVAVDNIGNTGLYIPNLPEDDWDPADPLGHTSLVKAANARTGNVFARVVRLLKYWNERHGSPMCSWNIKVLAMECLLTPISLADALSAFFNHAVVALERGVTEDPSGVAGPIELNMPKIDVVSRLRDGAERIDTALRAEAEGRPLTAQHHLSRLFPDLVDPVDPDALEQEEAARVRAEVGRDRSVGVGTAAAVTLPRSRSWSA